MRKQYLFTSILSVVVATCSGVRAQSGWIDVTTQTTPLAAKDASNDAALAFRDGILKLKAMGGGVLYVPAGVYKFDSQDPTASSCHVLIDQAENITIQGDSPGLGLFDSDNTGTSPRGALARPVGCGAGEPGSVVFSTTANTALFQIGQSAQISFRNLKLSRQTQPGSPNPPAPPPPQPAACALPTTITPVAGGEGILFRPIGTSGTPYVANTRLDNVVIMNQFDGIHVWRSSPTFYSRLNVMTLNAVELSYNERHGMFSPEWGNVSFTASVLYKNGQAGAMFANYWPEDSASHCGTLFFSNTLLSKNGSDGLQIIGQPPEGEVGKDVHDIHIAACQFDANGRNGIYMSYVQNVNIAASSFGFNGTSCTDGVMCYYRGMYLFQGHNASIAGCSFLLNSSDGAEVATSTGVAMSGCSFQGNNRVDVDGAHPRYGLNINGGSENVFGALTFRKGENPTLGARQVRGIMVQNSPVNTMISNITFSNDTTTRFTTFNNATATGRAQYWNPSTGAYVDNPIATP